jgi:hypothetical protein
MWSVGVIGLLGALIATAISFIPPSQVSTGSPVIYIGILVAGSALFVAIPFVLYAFHKPSWKASDSDFEPFEWQVEGRKPSEVSKRAAAAVPVA